MNHIEVADLMTDEVVSVPPGTAVRIPLRSPKS